MHRELLQSELLVQLPPSLAFLFLKTNTATSSARPATPAHPHQPPEPLLDAPLELDAPDDFVRLRIRSILIAMGPHRQSWAQLAPPSVVRVVPLASRSIGSNSNPAAPHYLRCSQRAAPPDSPALRIEGSRFAS